MAHGQSSPEAQRLIVRVIGDIAALPVPNPRESNIQNHLLDRVQVMADLRRGESTITAATCRASCGSD